MRAADALARSVTMLCGHCEGKAFRLIGATPQGLKIKSGEIGGRTSKPFNVSGVECVACGETYRITSEAAE